MMQTGKLRLKFTDMLNNFGLIDLLWCFQGFPVFDKLFIRYLWITVCSCLTVSTKKKQTLPLFRNTMIIWKK